MTAPKKPGAAGGAGHAQPPVPELTAEELSWAKRYFSAVRQVDQSMVHDMTDMVVRGAELLAEEYPRHTAPRLRLVTGGAK